MKLLKDKYIEDDLETYEATYLFENSKELLEYIDKNVNEDDVHYYTVLREGMKYKVEYINTIPLVEFNVYEYIDQVQVAMNSIKFVKSERKDVYVGLKEGKPFVDTYWDNIEDSCLYATYNLIITTIYFFDENTEDYDCLEFVDVGNYNDVASNTVDSAIRLVPENYEKLFNILTEK